jgi:phospholipid-binding lipoprotein MlaA
MPVIRISRRIVPALVVLCTLFASGCATTNDSVVHDPFERFNRAVYQFNEGFDQAIMEPVARGYQAVLPQFVRSSVSNFFSNINDVLVALNNVLQGKFIAAYSDVGRIAINSTLGVVGLFDIASAAGIEKNNEDFGQTLGYWGVAEGPFIMLPFFGPSNGRDLVGRIGDYFTDPVTYVDPTRVRNQMRAARIVNRRAELLETTAILDVAALDPYTFLRDAYTQRRRNLIHDGAAPLDLDLLDLDPPVVKPDPATKPPAKPKPAPLSWLRFLNGAREPAPANAAGASHGAGSVLVSGESFDPVAMPKSVH